MDITEDSNKRWEESESRAISNRQPTSKAHADWLSSRGDKKFQDKIVKIEVKDANGNAIHKLKEKSPELGRSFLTKPQRPRPTSNSSDWDRLEPSNARLEPAKNAGDHEDEQGGGGVVDAKKDVTNEKYTEAGTEKLPTRGDILWKTHKRPYRHLDEILKFKPDIPPGTTILGLLHLAESSTKQADVFLDDLERPDLALQEWVKVTFITESIIPDCQGYSSFTNDPGLLARYDMIKNWLVDNLAKFEEAKEFIKRENHRNSVQPSLVSPIDSTKKESELILADRKRIARQNSDSNDFHEDKVTGPKTNIVSSSKDSSADSVYAKNSQSPPEGYPADFTIYYPCHIRTCPDHQHGFSSLDILIHHYELAHGESYYLCDYPSCQSQTGSAILPDAKIRFLRCDFRGSDQDYRNHLQDFHKEDLSILSSNFSEIEKASFESFRFEADWWRCHSCLRRVIIKDEGYTCKDCKAICEPVRIRARKTRFGFGSLIENVDQATTGTISQQIPKQCTNIEYTHTEYVSNKFVPLTTIKQLGHGSLGVVDAVRFNENGDGILIARKIIRIPTFSRKKLLPLIQKEVAVLRGLAHQHIVRVISTYETTKAPREFGILIFPAGDEDLGHFLDRVSESDFPEEDIGFLSGWQCCLASAVAYIHSQNIRHKDIKPTNIICKGEQIYLTDFGSAHQFSAGNTSSTDGPLVGITKMYSAPEVIADDRRGRSADIYSLGCVFAEMATVADGERVEEFHEYRSQPIPDESDRMTYVYHATAHMIGPWFTELGDLWMASLLQEMLAVDQRRRPTAKNLVETLLTHYGPPNCLCQQRVLSI